AGGQVVRRVDVGPAPGGVTAAADGNRVVVTGGEQDGALWLVDPGNGRVDGPIPVGRVPRGVALSPDGATAWVTLHAESAVGEVDLDAGATRRRIDLAKPPYAIAVSPDGTSGLVSEGGPRGRSVRVLDLAGAA